MATDALEVMLHIRLLCEDKNVPCKFVCAKHALRWAFVPLWRDPSVLCCHQKRRICSWINRSVLAAVYWEALGLEQGSPLNSFCGPHPLVCVLSDLWIGIRYVQLITMVRNSSHESSFLMFVCFCLFSPSPFKLSSLWQLHLDSGKS